jgi:hypothetical protein
MKSHQHPAELDWVQHADLVLTEVPMTTQKQRTWGQGKGTEGCALPLLDTSLTLSARSNLKRAQVILRALCRHSLYEGE